MAARRFGKPESRYRRPGAHPASPFLDAQAVAGARYWLGIGFWTESRAQRKRGAMGKVRPTWLGAAAIVAIGLFLVACSHDPIQPAPVLMMGGNRATIATAPAIGAPRPASAPEMRVATAPPSLAGKLQAPRQRTSSRAAIVAKHPARTLKAARARLTTRHATVARTRTKEYAGVGRAARSAAGEEVVPLDNPTASTPSAVTPAPSASPLEPTLPSWVSPAPADPGQSQFRPPVP
jgi:hypothetical protein